MRLNKGSHKAYGPSSPTRLFNELLPFETKKTALMFGKVVKKSYLCRAFEAV